jgi:hypothetical protein
MRENASHNKWQRATWLTQRDPARPEVSFGAGNASEHLRLPLALGLSPMDERIWFDLSGNIYWERPPDRSTPQSAQLELIQPDRDLERNTRPQREQVRGLLAANTNNELGLIEQRSNPDGIPLKVPTQSAEKIVGYLENDF